MPDNGPTHHADPGRFASDVRDLLNACRAATTPKDLLGHCENLFRLLRDKKLELGVPFIHSYRSPVSSSTNRTGRDGFVKWLQQSFQTFVTLVFELLSSSEFHVQKIGLLYLFRIVKHESQVHQSAAFPLSVFQVFIAKLLQCEGLSSYLLEALVSDYAGKFWDVRYYLLVVIGKILREFTKQKSRRSPPPASAPQKDEDHISSDAEDEADEFHHCGARENEWYVWTKGEDELSKRLTSLLLQISKCFASDSEVRALRGKRTKVARAERESGSDSEDGGEELTDNEPAVKTYIDHFESSKALQFGNHRLAFQNAWLLLLLNVEHDKATTQKLLSNVPRSVMPYMSNPLLLADFFMKAFKDARQLSISISALSGMFYLLAKHRLGNPDVLDKTEGSSAASKSADTAGAHFYQRLYRLITPAAFAPRLRVRFLRLLNMALRSDLLPTCLVASFIKKCIRVACIVSPAATICLEALVISMLQKYHSTCKPLLNLPEHLAARLRVPGDGFDYCTAKIREGNEDSSFSDDEGMDDMREDSAVFELVNNSVPNRLKVNKTDISPLTRKEAKMSLWEIDLLSNHALKSVQQLSDIFDSCLGDPAAKRVCVDDFLDVTTGSLLSRELRALDKPSSAPIPALEGSTVPRDVPQLYGACMNIARQVA